VVEGLQSISNDSDSKSETFTGIRFRFRHPKNEKCQDGRFPRAIAVLNLKTSDLNLASSIAKKEQPICFICNQAYDLVSLVNTTL